MLYWKIPKITIIFHQKPKGYDDELTNTQKKKEEKTYISCISLYGKKILHAISVARLNFVIFVTDPLLAIAIHQFIVAGLIPTGS